MQRLEIPGHLEDTHIQRVDIPVCNRLVNTGEDLANVSSSAALSKSAIRTSLRPDHSPGGSSFVRSNQLTVKPILLAAAH